MTTPDHVATEAWFRNPDNYIRELVEVEQYNIVWDRGFLAKRHLDPDKHAELYFGKGINWRALLVGEQGSCEIGPAHSINKPKGVYPTWVYGEDASLLEEIIAEPVGEVEEFCMDLSVPTDERPVWQQEHRVVISGVPNVTSGPGKQFLRHLKALQEDYPECIIHLHGCYGHRANFGLGFRASDTEPRTIAQKGRVYLPSGKEVRWEECAKNPQWVTQLGYKPIDLSVPRVRCMYNIKSAVWAAENFGKLYNFPLGKTTAPVDTSTPTAKYLAPTGRSPLIGGSVGLVEGDMVVCDSCTLSEKCKYTREGAVCSVPGSDNSGLAKYFQTRDSDVIMDGLGKLMAMGTERLSTAREMEDAYGELDPEVTKLINTIFEQGVKLAKLVDPSLRGGARVQVNVGSGSQVAVSGSTPQQLVAGIMRELESTGVPRSEITPLMIKGAVSAMAEPERQTRVMEGEVIRREQEVI